MKSILYASTNPSKIQEVRLLLKDLDLLFQCPSDLGLDLITAETGTTLGENAVKKAEAYLPFVPQDTIVLGDDTGVFIDALGGEPGIYVRRWADHEREMTDKEIIDYCLEKMKNIKYSSRTATIETVIALAQSGKQTLTFSGLLEGHIIESPEVQTMPGFPFETLFFADRYSLSLGDIHKLSRTQKQKGKIMTHREIAIRAVLASLS